MRTELPLFLLLSGIPALSSCGTKSVGTNHQANRTKPNVIFFISDDLGIGDLSCYGADRISTPNIDRLAGQGIQFTNAYATSSTSTPSRFGILTGMYPWRQENTGIAPGNSGLIIDSTRTTMADMFKSEGYATAAIGKWHLGLGPMEGTDFNSLIKPNTQSIGFDYEYVIPATVDRVPCVFVENGRVDGLDPSDPICVSYDHKVGNWPTGLENPELVTLKPSQGHNNTIINGIPRIGWMTGGKAAIWKDEEIADIITAKAKKFITSNKEHPFFLYMGTQDVHVPRVPHPRFAGKSGMGTRGDVILQLDWTVGEIMRTLDSLDIARNTIFVFCSDNGPVIDDGYEDQARELLGSHTPMKFYRGGKYSAYEAGTRIPFIVRWPETVKPGKQQALFSMIDVYASFADLLGWDIPDGAAPDSRNALNVLLGKDIKDRENVVQQNLNNTLSIIKDGWKYIEPSNAPAIEHWTRMELGNSPSGELYDICEDPGEHSNLITSNPRKAAELEKELETVRNNSGAMRVR